MKRLLISAALLALFAGEAAAQFWGPPPPPPPYRGPPPPPYGGPPPPPYYGGPPPAWRHPRPYEWCAAKARHLHEFEYRMRLDGRISRGELQIADALRADLANSCGGGRWHPDRGWHYR